MNVLALVSGWLLPCVMGSLIVAALRGWDNTRPMPGAIAWTVGTGTFAGALVLTLLMRAASLAGLPFGIALLALPMLALSVVLGWRVWRRNRDTMRGGLARVTRDFFGTGLTGAWRVAWLVLLAWLTVRFALLLTEVIVRPLYPWDAWTQWATKAKVWYELRTMAPFVRFDQWIANTVAGFTDAGPHYPATVPLLMVWSNLLLGHWDDALMNLPFWILAVGFCIAVYGFLRLEGFGELGSLIGAWLVSALPLANTHVALSGYADLPLAQYFALAALAGYRWSQRRNGSNALLAIFFAAACPLIKIPGIVWMVTLVPGLIVAMMPRRGPRIVLAGFGVCILALLALAQTQPVVLGYSLHLDFAPDWGALGNSYFLFGNWHLLWYGAIAAAVAGRRMLLEPPLAVLTVVIIAGLLFLFFVFGFTNARDWVTDQTTVNRATLHLAPLICVWMLLVFRGWASARTGAAPSAAAA